MVMISHLGGGPQQVLGEDRCRVVSLGAPIADADLEPTGENEKMAVSEVIDFLEEQGIIQTEE